MLWLESGRAAISLSPWGFWEESLTSLLFVMWFAQEIDDFFAIAKSLKFMTF
jgi:hypothetical protein